MRQYQFLNHVGIHPLHDQLDREVHFVLLQVQSVVLLSQTDQLDHFLAALIIDSPSLQDQSQIVLLVEVLGLLLGQLQVVLLVLAQLQPVQYTLDNKEHLCHRHP
jgi:hypothetical protein